jgi:chloramphenicol 3-O phosphotransferase
MNPVAIVLNGASSSGKTTIARSIQRLSKTPVLHASLDTFTDMFCWPAISEPGVRGECHRFGVANFHAALPILASRRFPIVVDHVFEHYAWFEDCRDALKAKRTYFVGVRYPVSVLEERERARGDRKPGMARSQVARVHERKPYALEVDTSVQSPEECATEILRFVESAEIANYSPDPRSHL